MINKERKALRILLPAVIVLVVAGLALVLSSSSNPKQTKTIPLRANWRSNDVEYSLRSALMSSSGKVNSIKVELKLKDSRRETKAFKSILSFPIWLESSEGSFQPDNLSKGVLLTPGEAKTTELVFSKLPKKVKKFILHAEDNINLTLDFNEK